jgi:hypothetical protein
MAVPVDPTDQQAAPGWSSQSVTPAAPANPLTDAVRTGSNDVGGEQAVADADAAAVLSEKIRAEAAEYYALTTRENVAANVDSLASDADLPTTVTAVNALLSALQAAGLMAAGS